MKTNRRIAGALVAAGLLLGASACGGDDITVKTPDGSVKVDNDGSDFTVESDDGSVVTGGTKLPDDFPEDVPLIDGTIIQAIKADSAGGGGFTVSIETEGTLEDVYADAGAKLEASGFPDGSTQSVAGSMAIGSFENPTWQVLVQVTPSGDGGKVNISYTVVPQD